MIQIFILGSSSVYGVGAHTAGWADLVKQYFHQKMYGPGGVGEKYEVFNFGKAGEQVGFLMQNFPKLLEMYGRDGQKVIIYMGGRNNARAVDSPDNFVSTPEEYREEVSTFVAFMKEHGDKVIFIPPGVAVDESKTSPKPSPFGDGRKSYFTNARSKIFGDVAREVCTEQGITYVDVDITEDEWIKKYLYEDGLHANQAGHQLIFEAVKPHLNI